MFSALAEERIYRVPAPRRDDARRREFSLAGVGLAYVLAFVALMLSPHQIVPGPPLEIPVEVVIAPPPEPPTPPKVEAPEPPKKSLAPAYDAPKAGTAAHDDGDLKLDGKPAPAADAPDKSAERDAGAEAEATKPAAEAPSEAPPTPAPPIPELKTAEEGEVPLATAPTPNPAPAGPTSPRAFAALGKSPHFSALPNVAFGGAPVKAPVAGGEGPAEYLNIVVGLIRQHLRKPRETAPPGGSPFGVMVFTLDSDGHLVTSWFVQHSGSPALDAAEQQALEAASPFPKPPYFNRSIEYHFTVD